MVLTAREAQYCSNIADRLRRLREFVGTIGLGDPEDPAQWLSVLTEIRAIQGNLSNDISFVATLMAKQYLADRFGVADFDAAAKPQGATGLDIQAQAADGRRVAAELKTTVPYLGHDFGAQQKQGFQRDFEKLRKAEAEIKVLFVTDHGAFTALKATKYRSQLAGITVVLLTTKDCFTN